MAKRETTGPVSAAGLVRYFDVSGGGIEVKPETVVIGAVLFIVVIAILGYIL